MSMRPIVVVLTVGLLSAVPAFAATLATDGTAAAQIVLAADAAIAEQTSANELADYLGKITGGEFTVQTESATRPDSAIYVGPTQFAEANGIDAAKLAEEEWVIRTVDDNLILLGGGARGTLYAVYRFLEEVLGVHWWNPWEESVPNKPTLDIGDLDLTGKPVLRYRDIYMLYGYDGGRCAARNRLNRQGDARISKTYGGCMDYGPPYHVHTFYMYVRPKTYFDEHPEWFSLIEGKRTGDRTQLCLTNQELRDVIVQKLKAYIESSRKKAEEAGVPAPVVYEISQNDWRGACQCEKCQAIAKAEESEAGVLIDFLNYISDATKDEYPDIYISTLAYQYTQKPPKNIEPRDNIIFRLCDTTSNFTKPITAPENTTFHEFLLSWAKIAKNLRIWDYAVTYAAPRGMPFPSVHTYPADYQFYAEHNVEGVFTEHEFPVIGDMHDLKAWMMMKLLEDPYRDYDALLGTFTDGFYGPAGPQIREYLEKLQAASDAKTSHISMGSSPTAFGFLDFDFVSDAQAIFDRAEQAVADDPILLRRVRHARLSLDRATVVLFRRLMADWRAAGNDPANMPLDRKAIAERYKDTWYTQIDFRIPEGRREAERKKCDAEIVKYASLPAYVPLPEKFRDSPQGVFDFTADVTRNWKNIVKVVKDDEAETGITNRLQFPTEIDSDKQPLERYKMPMPWGLYQPSTKTFSYSESIAAKDVPGPGYHWYKMKKPHKIGPSYYLYFFWSWIIQLDIDSVIDPKNPDGEFDIWARIKFEGPFFPHGKAEDKNAICVERIVLVKAGPE